MKAPTTPQQDGFMRARPESTATRCLGKSGKWRPLICFVKKQTRYLYLWTYEIATDFDGSQLIGEFDDFVPYEPTSVAGKHVIRTVLKEGTPKEEAL